MIHPCRAAAAIALGLLIVGVVCTLWNSPWSLLLVPPTAFVSLWLAFTWGRAPAVVRLQDGDRHAMALRKRKWRGQTIYELAKANGKPLILDDSVRDIRISLSQLPPRSSMLFKSRP